MRRAPAALALLVLTALAWPGDAAAHARLRATVPAAGATLGTAPAFVTLTFTERPDLRLTSIKVLDGAGTNHAAGPVEAAPDPPLSVRVPVGDLPDGGYTVSWRAVSAVDGHISAGSFVFGVGVAPPASSAGPAPPDASESGSPPAVGTRWILYLGLLLLIGAAWVALAVARRPHGDLLAMAAVGWVLTAVGSVGVVAVQWAETGAPLETLPSTSLGLAALLRVAALALIAAALAGLAAVPRLAGTRGWAAVGGAAAMALLVDVVTGHAAADPTWIAQVPAQWAHGLGAAAWLGGLAGLLVVLRTTPVEDRLASARRYSGWAAVSLGVVAVTGAARAFAAVGTLDNLLRTDYGRVVIAKSGLLLGLAALGATNRFWTLRVASRVPRVLSRVASAELGLAVVVLGLSAMLVNLSPPSSAPAQSTPVAQPVVATGHDFGTSMRARLVVAPGAAGSNAFDLSITDYDSGAPVDASAVALRFELVSLAGVAPSTVELARTSSGHFGGAGPNLSIDGIWRATATVTVPGGAVAVPVVLATRVADQPVQQLVSAGAPTIYQVNLGAIGSAQVYLDPGGPGTNDLHVTFFDAAGNEQPIQSATIVALPARGDGIVLAPRLLEPGHFVTSTDAVAGALTVDAVTPLPAGRGNGQIHLHVTIEVTP
jgi:copper transport protein